jgi:hypothetical protein
MNEVASQDDTPERFGAWVQLGTNEKQLIEDAGQALIRGEAGAADSLISAAMPLCVFETGKLHKRYRRLWQNRDEFRVQAKQVLCKAVASLDSRSRDGSLEPIQSFNAYLSKCIYFGLMHYSRQSDREWRKMLAEEFTLEGYLDEIEIKSLRRDEKKVFVGRKRGKTWKEIAASIKRVPRTAQRIFKRAELKIKKLIENPTVYVQPDRLHKGDWVQ